MTKTFEELVKEFESVFPSEKKERDYVADWLMQQRKFSFYFPPESTVHPLEKILEGLAPMGGKEHQFFSSPESFNHTLEHIWSSRNKEREEAQAILEWEDSLHKKAKEFLAKLNTPPAICAVYRFDNKDFEPVPHEMKFPKYKLLTKGTRLAGEVKLFYRLYERAFNLETPKK